MSANRSLPCNSIYRHALPLVILLTVGCAKSASTCSLSGEVLVNEKPAEGVYIVAHQSEIAATTNPQISGSARTDEDGNFELQVNEPGQYAITVFWPKKIVEQDQTIEGEDQFKGRYRDPRKPVSSVELDEGPNEPTEFKLSL